MVGYMHQSGVPLPPGMAAACAAAAALPNMQLQFGLEGHSVPNKRNAVKNDSRNSPESSSSEGRCSSEGPSGNTIHSSPSPPSTQ